ncbi:MAG: FadR family transcriptional regulator [Clostridia bacterium]|nr:FadR family transcriptional regulator [Clostridia bacterium]
MFSPIKSKKVYEYVIDQIQEMIMEGTLKKGDKLPSERELAEQLQVSRTSIREAMRALEIIGLIESKQGEGNFIREKIEGRFFEPLSVMFMLNRENPEDILELRMIVEIEAAYLAAKRVNKKDKEELKELLSRMKEATNEKIRAKVDKELHYRIAKITGNYFVVNLLNGISMLMESFIIYAREKILEDIDDNELLIMQHEEICNAIIEGDSDKAARAMRNHLELIVEHMVNK